MSDTEAPVVEQQNGKPPAPPAGIEGLPEGTITLPPGMVARITRLLQEDPRVRDSLYSYIEGKGETGPYTLVVPVLLLVKPQPGQPG